MKESKLQYQNFGAPGRNRTHALALQKRTSTIKDTRAMIGTA